MSEVVEEHRVAMPGTQVLGPSVPAAVSGAQRAPDGEPATAIVTTILAALLVPSGTASHSFDACAPELSNEHL
jgi:hypothetical protein